MIKKTPKLRLSFSKNVDPDKVYLPPKTIFLFRSIRHKVKKHQVKIRYLPLLLKF